VFGQDLWGQGNAAGAEYRLRVIDDSRRIAELAGEVGITISFEYHEETLTDTSESAYPLLKEINHPNVRSYWQMTANLMCKHVYQV